ncbi:MAG: hypothetical protein ACFUZC_18505 [Chthoniobacteraceae bacterium]
MMKKLPLLALFALTLTLAAAPLRAQSAPGPEPAALSAQFFQTLTEGRVDAAYDQLLKGSKMVVDMPKGVADLKAKTKEALRIFGSMNGFEQIEEKKVGTRIVRLTCVSLGKSVPIRWRFYFYKPDDAWMLVDIRIDDRLTDLFDEQPRLIQAATPQQGAPARK